MMNVTNILLVCADMRYTALRALAVVAHTPSLELLQERRGVAFYLFFFFFFFLKHPRDRELSDDAMAQVSERAERACVCFIRLDDAAAGSEKPLASGCSCLCASR